MHPFFIAMGPGFREGAEVPTFKSVDVYPLMCHLLDLHPAPNNGSLDSLRPLLREDDEKTTVMTFGTCVLTQQLSPFGSAVVSVKHLRNEVEGVWGCSVGCSWNLCFYQ